MSGVLRVRLAGAGRARHISAATFGEASRVCRQYITEHDLGASDWTGGDLFIEHVHVAHVSFNGTVWPPEPWHAGLEPIWKPTAEEVL